MDHPWQPDRSFWRHRPVAVTGATGFLGSHLVDQLVGLEAAVVVLVRDVVPKTSVVSRWAGKVSEVSGRVEDRPTVERMLGEYDVHSVFHLAAQTQVEVANRNPASTFESNVAGTWSVLESARRSPLVDSVVLASSDKAYGEQAQLPYTESMPLHAVHPYDVSKACSDMLGQSYASTFSVPVAITRCGNFYGPGDTNWRRLIPGTTRDVLFGRSPVVRSDGSPTRDYLYVVDGAWCYIQLAEALAKDNGLRGEAFNFSTEQPLSALEVIELVQRSAGTSLEPTVLGEARHEIPHQFLSAEKARRVLGWTPRYTVQTAMDETVEWYRSELATS